MTRPLRIDVEGGWYHVISRGIERRVIFPDESYCVHFLELLGEMSVSSEQPDRSFVARRIPFERIVSAVE